MARKLLAGVLSAIALTAAAHAETFVFTAIPDEDASRLRQRFDKVAGSLSRTLGVEVRYVPVKSYSAAVSAFRNNQVQLALFGGMSVERALALVNGSESIAQGREDRFFVTYFIAHPSAGVAASENFPKGIAGKTFTFGSKGSTSGRLMPEFHIRKNLGKAPRRAFARVGYSGDHSRTIALVQSGAYQVGAVSFKVWENEMKAGKIDPEKITVIWRTPSYPDYQWTIRGDVESRFGAGFKDRVKNALLDLTDKDVLASFPRARFVPAANSDYRPILETGQAIGLMD